MQPVRKIALDGLVPNSFHLSSRTGNKTPHPFKGDTATESALKFIADPKGPSFFPYANIATNNRCDTDGLLSAFTLIHPEQAESRMETLIAAAEAGAFSSFSSEAGVQIDLFLSGLMSDSSPFARSWKKEKMPKEALYYKTVLPLLPDLLDKRDEYKELWRKSFDQILASMMTFEKRMIGVEEYPQEGVTVVLDEVLPAPHAMDTYCKGNLFLIIQDCQRHNGGYRYRLVYRSYAWAETVRRPRLPRISMDALARELNALETSVSLKQEGCAWRTSGPGMPPTGALAFLDASGQWGLSSLQPTTVVQSVLSYLRKMKGEEKSVRREGTRTPVRPVPQPHPQRSLKSSSKEAFIRGRK